MAPRPATSATSSYVGKPSVVVGNTLGRQFDVEAPDRVCVTAIRTLEGFDYLAIVIDLFSPRVIRWSMQSLQTTDVVLQALLMAGSFFNLLKREQRRK